MTKKEITAEIDLIKHNSHIAAVSLGKEFLKEYPCKIYINEKVEYIHAQNTKLETLRFIGL